MDPHATTHPKNPNLSSLTREGVLFPDMMKSQPTFNFRSVMRAILISATPLLTAALVCNALARSAQPTFAKPDNSEWIVENTNFLPSLKRIAAILEK